MKPGGIAEAIAQLATKADLAASRSDMLAMKADLEAKLALLEQCMTIRLGGMMIVALGVILAGVKFIHWAGRRAGSQRSFVSPGAVSSSAAAWARGASIRRN